MTVSKRWKIQNKLYALKEREKNLERIIEDTKEDFEVLDNVKLFKRPKDAPIYVWYASMCLFLFLNLDKLFGYIYMRYKAYKEIKNVKRKLTVTRKEIEYYEQC
jgi:hypothetical protein